MSSKLEQKVESILKANRITYVREYSFSDLVGYKNVPLRFDFAVFYKGKLHSIIEVDGAQHFKFTKHFHKTLSNFKKSLEWDRRKNKYCLLHNIPLIRIPYWDCDEINFNKIFKTKEYFVKDIYHNDNLIRSLGGKY